MKKAIMAAVIVVLVYLVSLLFKVDPTRTLITMMAYWMFLDRLEKDGDNED